MIWNDKQLWLKYFQYSALEKATLNKIQNHIPIVLLSNSKCYKRAYLCDMYVIIVYSSTTHNVESLAILFGSDTDQSWYILVADLDTKMFEAWHKAGKSLGISRDLFLSSILTQRNPGIIYLDIRNYEP